MYSYLHNEPGDTQCTDRARLIRFDEFTALCHGDVVIVHTFVGCVLWWYVSVRMYKYSCCFIVLPLDAQFKQTLTTREILNHR